jgi:diacylglycerol kinase family enzyme
MARFWHARHMAMGTAHLAPNVSITRVTHAVVETEGPMEFHVDGEPGIAEGPLEVRMLPRALKVRTALVSG